MLKKLLIQNYALIRELELSFDSGFNIITGETGAGKSIMIGAIGLILGNRADVTVLNDKNRKCFVEAVFDMDRVLLVDFFEEHQIDIDDYIILRRQINPQGKSRAFINDTPVKLPVLRELSSLLIDVNSQHQTFSLNDSDIQMQLLDDFAGLNKSLAKYRSDFLQYKALNKRLNQIIEQENSLRSEQDYLQFQFDELEKANLRSGEFDNLEKEFEVLNHAEEIKAKLFESESLLQTDDNGIIENLSTAVHSINSITNYHTDYSILANRLESTLLELQDIVQEIETMNENIEFDPSKLDELNSRINLLNHLQQKHVLESVEDLIEFKNKIYKQLFSINHINEDKDSLQKEITVLFDKLINNADEIHDSRVQVIDEVELKIKENLAKLGMKGANFKIDILKSEQLSSTGNTKLQFLFSANKGINVAPISKVASGGELSRLMLTLKYVLTSRKSLSTIIFDEIDTGVSGDIASMVGDMMKSMGMNMQLIAITHLPQIAGKAKSHYKVFKQEFENKTISSIRLLDDNERIEELSMMLSGKRNSEAAIATARELME